MSCSQAVAVEGMFVRNRLVILNDFDCCLPPPQGGRFVTHTCQYIGCVKMYSLIIDTPLSERVAADFRSGGNIWISKLYSSRHLSFSPVEVSLTSFLSFWLCQVVNDRFG